jgi:hypothetical protein
MYILQFNNRYYEKVIFCYALYRVSINKYGIQVDVETLRTLSPEIE